MSVRGPDGHLLPKYPKVGPATKSRHARGACHVCGAPATRTCEARHGWERDTIRDYVLCSDHGSGDLRWALVQAQRAARKAQP